MATKVYSFLFFLNEVSIFLTKTDGAVKLWKQLQEEYSLANKLKFEQFQLIHSLPKLCIEQALIDSGN